MLVETESGLGVEKGREVNHRQKRAQVEIRVRVDEFLLFHVPLQRRAGILRRVQMP